MSSNDISYLADGDATPVTSIPTVPVTEQRPVWTEHNNVKEAGMARANVACTEQSPEGSTYGNFTKDRAHQTVLQQHLDFFDLNHDNIITPLETFIGFRRLGWNIVLAMMAVSIIHIGFSYGTQNSWVPDPLFRILTENIHKAKHGSDSTTFDNEGRWKAQGFEDLFAKYGQKYESKDGSGETQWGLTFTQALGVINGQRVAFDFFGIFASLFEWFAVYLTLWPEDGVMKMEDIRGVFDGSIFYTIADRRNANLQGRSKLKMWKKGRAAARAKHN
ncbi:unnamed protein product [Somion occarium]|uniref:Caleosin n=1 Tax=Somion occarium TaxID=3059160 RepID=A0ABP1CQG8_9APHY